MKKAWIIAVATVLATAAAASAADVQENWTKNCASCHGKDGKGQTKAGKIANVKDMTDTKYQESLSDEKMIKQIKDGMKEGEKERMKPYGDKLSADEIKALVKHVRAFKK